MERLTTTSDKGGVAFTFDLEVEATPQEMVKILHLAEKLKYYEDAEEQGRLLVIPCKIGDRLYWIDEFFTAPATIGSRYALLTLEDANKMLAEMKKNESEE